MTIKVSGGIINDQTLSGNLRYFKMTGPFAWTISDGSVNLPLTFSGGNPAVVNYFVVGADKPVPESAAEIALRTIALQCSVVIVSVQPATYGSTTAIHFATGQSNGWGPGLTPEYELVAGQTDVTIPPPLAVTAAVNMQAAVNALGTQTVYVSVGTANPATAPVTATANLGTVTITEVPFALA